MGKDLTPIAIHQWHIGGPLCGWIYLTGCGTRCKRKDYCVPVTENMILLIPVSCHFQVDVMAGRLLWLWYLSVSKISTEPTS